MPNCNLLATGTNFDVDEFLNLSPWRDANSIFRRGEATDSKLRPFRTSSGFRIDLSDAEDELLES